MGARPRGFTLIELLVVLAIVATVLTLMTPMIGRLLPGAELKATAAALVTAACGVNIAKHGNRAASSKSGAADVLTALGVNIDADLSLIRQAAHEAGICFMMAPRHHGAMRNVGPTRVELGTRTIFNLLGPMSNPAGVKRQLIGVFAREWIVPMVETLKTLGSEKIWVVHGSDGTDELTTTGPSYVAALENDEIRAFEVTPADAGLPTASLEDLKGGDAEHNAAALRGVLAGEPGPYRDIVVFNAAAALVVAGRSPDLKEGAAKAADAIDTGAATAKLEKLIEITNRTVPEGK